MNVWNRTKVSLVRANHVILKFTCTMKFIAVKHNAFVQVFYCCNFIHGFIFFVFLSFAEQFMEFDEDNSGDIGKLSA